MLKKFLNLALFLFLVIFLLFSAFSCGNEKNENANEKNIGNGTNPALSEPEITNMRFTEELPEKDCGGAEFNILVQMEPPFRFFYDVDAEGITGDLINDTVYGRNMKIEERFNISINAAKNDNAKKIIENSVNSGDDLYNAVWMVVNDYFALSLTGAFCNLHAAPYINLEKGYWDQNAVRDMSMSGKLYGLTGDISTATNLYTNLMLFNKSLAAAREYPNMYQMVLDGTWTYENFKKLIKDAYIDLNNSGKPDKDDFFGVEVTNSVHELFFSGSGEKWITKNDSDELVFSELTQRKIDALISIQEMFTKNNYSYFGNQTEDIFLDNRALFWVRGIGRMIQCRDSDVDFGILPIPKYDEKQENYCVYAYPFFPFLSIPGTITGEKREMTGIVLEALAAESYRTLTPAFYEVALASKFTRDEESYEMLSLIINSRTYDLLYLGGFGNFRSEMETMHWSGNPNFVSLYEKHADTVKAASEKVMDTYANILE
jgi:hypothetical protein